MNEKFKIVFYQKKNGEQPVLEFINKLDKKIKAKVFKDIELLENVGLQPEYEIIEAILKARIESGLTQKELSKLTGIAQSDLSKIETGNANPSLKTLKRIAEGLGKKLEIKFI